MWSEEQKKLLKQAAEIDRKAAEASKESEDSFGTRAGRWLKEAAGEAKQGFADTLNTATLGLVPEGWAALGLAPTEANQAMTDSFANVATGGLQGLYDRYVGAGTDVLGQAAFGGGEQEMSFGDFVNKRTEDRQRRRQEYPAHSIVGGIGGGLVSGAAAAKGIQAGGSELAKRALSSATGRIGSAAAAGALENVATEAGEGGINSIADMLTPAALGAAGGAVGQAAGEIIPKLWRGASDFVGPGARRRHGMREAASSLMDPATGGGSVAAASGKPEGYSIDDLLALSEMTGGPQNRMFGEGSEGLLDVTAALAGSREVTGTTDSAAEIARQRIRETPEALRGLLTDNLTDSARKISGDDAAALSRLGKTEAKAMYSQIFDTPAARQTPVITKKELLDLLSPDPQNDTASIRSAYKLFEDVLPQGSEQGELTLKGLHNVKIELDKRIASAWSDSASSIDKVSAAHLLEMKTMVNDLIGDIEPSYKEAARLFGTDMKREELVDLGAKMLRGTNTSMPLNTMEDYLKGMSVEELGAVQDGALRWLTGQVDQSPNYIKKLAAENPDAIKRLSLIFGNALDNNSGSLDDLAEKVNTQLTNLSRYNKIAAADESAGKHVLAKPAESSLLQGTIDRAAVLASILSGHPLRGTLTTSARRVANEPNQVLNQTLFNLMTASKPEEAQALLSEIFKYGKKPEPSMAGGILGMAVGTGLNAPE